MAISTSVWFSNALVGVPQIGGDVNVYEEHTSPRFAIGQKYERQDGSIFRYAHFGATVDSAGYLVSQDVSESSVTMTPLVVVASSSTYQMPNEQAGVYPCMKNSRYLVITKASVTADDYAGGYITLSSGNTAQGTTYRIKGNTTTGTPDSGNVRFELYDKLVAGVGSSTSFTIIGNRWANLETSGVGGTTDSVVAGVTMIPITTAGNCGWVQTKGVAGVYCGESTVLAARTVSMSTETGAAMDLATAYVSALTSTAYGATMTEVIGVSIVNSTAGTWVPIVLQIE